MTDEEYERDNFISDNIKWSDMSSRISYPGGGVSGGGGNGDYKHEIRLRSMSNELDIHTKRHRAGSISGRLRTASDLEECGFIDKSQKGVLKVNFKFKFLILYFFIFNNI